MNEELDETFAPKRTATGLLLLAIGLTVSALATTVTLPYTLNTASIQDQINSGSNTLLLSLIGCLSPLALLLAVIGLFLVAGESKKFGKSHERLAWFGSVLYVVSIVVSLAVTIPLSFVIASQGSLSLALLSSWLSAVFTLIGIAGLALVLYPYAGPGLGKIILAVSGVEALLTLANTVFILNGAKMVELTILNQTNYSLQPATGGMIPVLTIASLVITWFIAGISILLAVRYGRQVKNTRSESVV
jgi:hypothetical protein